MQLKKLFHFLTDERGGSLVELALMMPTFMVLLFSAIDFGQAYYMSTEISGAAHAAAAYGAQNPTDTTGMTNVAKYDAPDVSSLAVTTPTYGCECSDGTSYSASCSTTPSCSGTTVVYRVNVTVTGTYRPLVPWPGILTSMSISGKASMRSAGS